MLIPSLNQVFVDVWEAFTPLNTIYPQNQNEYPLDATVIYDPNTISALYNGNFSTVTYRNITFKQDMGKALIVSMPDDNGCIHVLDSNQLEFPINMDPLLFPVAKQSKIDQIENNYISEMPKFYSYTGTNCC